MKNRLYLVITLIFGIFLGKTLFTPISATASSLNFTPLEYNILVDNKEIPINTFITNDGLYTNIKDITDILGFNIELNNNNIVLNKAISNDKALSKTPIDYEIECEKILELTNKYRIENGVNSLSLDPMLSCAAQIRADEMAATTTYSHKRPDGSSFYTVTDCEYMAENLHRLSIPYLEYIGYGLGETAVKEWIESTGHRNNILNKNVSHIGIGIAKGFNSKGDESYYIVQEFIQDGYKVSKVYELNEI